MTVQNGQLTAPALLWMNTPRAHAVATLFVLAALVSLPDYNGGDNRSLPWLVLSVLVVAAGIAGLMATRADPMPVAAALAVGASIPAAALITAVAVPVPPSSPNQTNALGAGVALCAFMCVRGQVKIAWLAELASLVIFTVWGHRTGQGALAGFTVILPNLAVLLMATVFARVMRPAALEVRKLHAAAAAERGEISELNARRIEGERQNQKLQELAWPTVNLMASESPLTSEQIIESLLTEARLRDSVRAPILDIPGVVMAARAARQRNVEVTLYDDKGMDEAPASTVAAFRAVAVEWLSSVQDGKITVRVLPPRRPLQATIVAIAADGTQHDLDLSADGTITTG